MTTSDRECIAYLQRQGMGYRRIAAKLELSQDTVKSYCVRNPLKAHESACFQCGQPIEQVQGRKEKRFCSDACRMAWWRAHPKLLNRKAFYDITCACCGEPFKSYGNARRKYCCRSCYDKARSKGVKP